MPDTLQPLVTVYIPSRNYGKFLAQAVQSLFDQLHTRWEAFIVDEASEDDSAAIAATFEARDPGRVTLIRNEKPMGLQKVANHILGLARGKYIVRLDADDWFDEGALLLMSAKLESKPDLGIAYGNYFFTDEAGKVIGTERRHRLGIEDTAGHLAPHGACTMVRTRSLKAIGGYSEDINAQDGWELWYKLQKRVGAASLDIPLFYYRQHGDSLSRDKTRLLSARGQIFKKISDKLQGGFRPETLAVIAVREDYPDFAGVPYRKSNGRSLLEIAINNATSANNVTTVAVSSQSQAVLDFAEKLEKAGRVEPHQRLLRCASAHRDEDDATLPAQSIMLHAGEWFHNTYKIVPDVLMFLSIHAMRRTAEHIDKALDVLRITESDSVVSVQEERDPIFVHGKDGLDLLNPGRFQNLAYDRERLYRFNGAIISTWWEVLTGGSLLGEKIGYIEMSVKDSLRISHPSLLETESSHSESLRSNGG